MIMPNQKNVSPADMTNSTQTGIKPDMKTPVIAAATISRTEKVVLFARRIGKNLLSQLDVLEYPETTCAKYGSSVSGMPMEAQVVRAKNAPSNPPERLTIELLQMKLGLTDTEIYILHCFLAWELQLLSEQGICSEAHIEYTKKMTPFKQNRLLCSFFLKHNEVRLQHFTSILAKFEGTSMHPTWNTRKTRPETLGRFIWDNRKEVQV